MDVSDTESKAMQITSSKSPTPMYCDNIANGNGIPKTLPLIHNNKMSDEAKSTQISSVQSTNGM